MTTARYLVTAYLNICLPVALMQPEPRQTRPPPARSRRSMPARAAATAAGTERASMGLKNLDRNDLDAILHVVQQLNNKTR